VTEVEDIGRMYAKMSPQVNGQKRSELENNIRRAEEQLPFVKGTVKSELEADIRNWKAELENLGDVKPILYTVDIPDDNGSNYIKWDEEIPAKEKERIRESFVKYLSEKMSDKSPSERDDVMRSVSTELKLGDGRWCAYYDVMAHYTSNEEASRFLFSLGYVGISYSAKFPSRGLGDGKLNYVVFNDSDLKVVDRVEFMRTPKGTVYGWTVGGKIYLTKAGINPNTPIHEYTHIWAEAMRRKNPEAWNGIKDLLRGTSVWDEVMSDGNYSDIHGNEDAVASEVLSRISGRENARKMEAEARRLIDAADGVMDKAKAVTLLGRMKKALEIFWSWVGKDLFGIKDFKSIDEVTDRVLYDLVSGTDLGIANVGHGRAELMMGDARETFDERQRKAVANNGTVMPGLNEAKVKIVKIDTKFPFNVNQKTMMLKNEVLTYASSHGIIGTMTEEETHGKGKVSISKNSIGKMVDDSASNKSVDKETHLAIIPKLRDVIAESVMTECHPDYNKGKDGKRGPSNGYNPDNLMYRCHGAVSIDGRLYRVKLMLKETTGDKLSKKAYSYEVTKIEVLDGQTIRPKTVLSRNSNTSNGSSYVSDVFVSGANLLKGVEKSYDTGIKILNESKKIDARADLRGGKKTNKDKISSHYDAELEKMSRGNADEDADVNEDTARYRTVSELAGEIDPTVTLEDYYEYTDATFDAVKTVDHSDDSRHPYEKKMLVKAEWEDMKASHPDWEWHRSPKDGSRSEYLIDRENGDVYRYSDHWGVLATCNWKLNGSDVRYETAIGKANISDFRRNNVTAYKYAKAERIIRLQRAEQFPAMRAEAERLGMKFNVRINVIEDVESVTYSVPYIQERRRHSRGWYDTATGRVYIVLPNNRDVEDVRATVFHETVGHKGLRELIGEKGYGDFLREVYEHADRDVRRRIDSLAEKRRWNRDKATDEYLSVLAERDFKDFDDAERSVWQWLKDKVLKAIDMFLGSLRLPEWVKLSDNELRYILWRSKERLERGKESPMDTARDVMKRRELGIDNGLYSMGYSDTLLRFNDNIMHPVASENDDKLAVTSLPSDTEIPVTEIIGYDVSVAEAVHVIDGLPNKVITFDGVMLNISRTTRNKLKNEISKHKNDVDVLFAFSQLESVVNKSILIEEHRDRIKVDGERKADNPSYTNIEKTQRFYGAVSVNGVIYRVKTTAIVSKESSNSRMHNYEVTKIELLPSIASTRQNAYTAAGNNSITLAKLLKDVEFSYEKGKKLLDEIDNGTSIGLNAADSVTLNNDILEREREEYEDGDEIGVYESGGRWRAEGFAFSRPTKEQLLDAVRSLYSDYAVSLSEDGSYMKALNGEPTNLSEKQWAQVRTEAFKEWFGDWEKASRIEKLRNAEAVEIRGDEIEPDEDLTQYKKNALEYGKKLRREYTNKDKGTNIKVNAQSIKEVIQYDYKDIEHLQSVAAIPKIIENGIYIDTVKNESNDNNSKIIEYQYYVCGLKIGGLDYTVKSVIAVDNNGHRYYDHKLTSIEKGKLLNELDRITNPSSQENSAFTVYKDKRLISILQINSSKILDDNGEPLVVDGLFLNLDDREPLDEYCRAIDWAKSVFGGDAGVLLNAAESERRCRREAQNRTIDEATTLVTGKDVKLVFKERIARSLQKKYTKWFCGVIFSDVSLHNIYKYMADAAPNNPFGRGMSERLPQRKERGMH